MGCSCKQTPLQKVERRIQSSGWTRLANSELGLIDIFIHTKLGEYPSNPTERIEMYNRAKAL
jgi:hypothetical protein